MSAQTYNQQRSYRNGYRPQQYPNRPAQEPQTDQSNPPERSFDEVVEFCKELGLDAEVVGRWIWVTFAQKPDRDMIKALKDFGFHWSPRREKWAHNCGHPSQPGSGNPWDKYEHYPVDQIDTEAPNHSRGAYGSQRRYA